MNAMLPGFSSLPGDEDRDDVLDGVEQFFRSIPDFERRAGGAIRRALDQVIDGPNTGRWDIADLEKVEKTYIGLRVEILLRSEFELPRGEILDCNINGAEVDIKFTIGSNWMIPPEAFEQICLLATASDYRSVFSIGLTRSAIAGLNKPNRDGKRSISSTGKQAIRWLVHDGSLPENVLLHIDPATREQIFSHTGSGQQRVIELFRLVQNRIIPREVIESVAQQKDLMRRGRQSRTALASERIIVICGTYDYQREEARLLGLPEIPADDWISIEAPPRWIWQPGNPHRWILPER